MLDTLKLYTEEFTIKDSAKLMLQPGQMSYESGDVRESKLFKRESGKPVLGASAFIKDDPRYHLQIMPKGGSVLAFVQCSIPKVARGENFYPATEVESSKALECINDALWERGVHLDLKSAKVSRVDLFTNAYCSEPFSTYRPLFELLRCKRQQRRDYGSTYLYSNTQRVLCIYDKQVEMINRGAKVAGLPKAMRFELRYLNAQVAKKELGFSRAGELVSSLDHVREVYNKELLKSFFKFVPGEVEVLAASQLETEMMHYQANYGRNWLETYQKALGARSLLEFGEEIVKANIEKRAGYRMAAWRMMKRINDAHLELAMLRNESGQVKTLRELYSELRQLVLEL